MDNKFLPKWAVKASWFMLAILLLYLVVGYKIGLADSLPLVAQDNLVNGEAFFLANLAPGDQIFSASGTLDAGEINEPGFPVYTERNVNLKLQVPAVTGSGVITMTFIDGTGATKFTGVIRDGETLWTTLTLKPGNNNNIFRLQSGAGSPTMNYELLVYEVANAPYIWNGVSQSAGMWRSHVRLNFPTAGLYQFAFDYTAGRYQFLVDNDYIQKTVTADGNVGYYISAGVHDLYIEPDTHSTDITWSLNITGPGEAVDTLPYTKTGNSLGGAANDFAEEWLPVNLAGATSANFKLKLTGSVSNTLDVRLYGATGATATHSIQNIYGGETLWWNGDLPAGLSRIQLVADAGNADSLNYELTINERPAIPATWTGLSNKSGNNSVVRFQVDTAGLYDLGVFNLS